MAVDEILEGGLPEGLCVMLQKAFAAWPVQLKELAVRNSVISSPTLHCYLDYPLNNIDLEKIYGIINPPDEASHGR